MLKQMRKEIKEQAGTIEEIRILGDYLDGDIESFMEGKDLLPFRRDMGYRCFIALGIMDEKLKELATITRSLNNKIDKLESGDNENPA